MYTAYWEYIFRKEDEKGKAAIYRRRRWCYVAGLSGRSERLLIRVSRAEALVDEENERRRFCFAYTNKQRQQLLASCCLR